MTEGGRVEVVPAGNEPERAAGGVVDGASGAGAADRGTLTDGSAVLRVLSGRLAGTSKPLRVNGTVSIGHQFWQDVVIRDPQTKGTAVDLSLNDGGQAQLAVLEGEAELLGQTIRAGGSAILPAYVPFSIGGVSLGWGAPESDRWSEAGGLVAVTPTEPAGPLELRDHAAAALGRAQVGAVGLMSRRNLLIAGAVLAAIILAFSVVPLMDALHLRATPRERVAAALSQAGLSDLKVGGTDDTITVTGVVAADAQRTKAQAVLRDADVGGTVDVQTSNELAQAAADVARGRGLQANAKPIARTGVELHTSPLTDETRASLIQAVRTDVRQVGLLNIRDDLPSPDDVPIKSVSDLTHKVSTVVVGDPSYIQTVDGARYFSGALMPSGHRLLGIEPNNIYLEKNGRQTKLAF